MCIYVIFVVMIHMEPNVSYIISCLFEDGIQPCWSLLMGVSNGGLSYIWRCPIFNSILYWNKINLRGLSFIILCQYWSNILPLWSLFIGVVHFETGFEEDYHIILRVIFPYSWNCFTLNMFYAICKGDITFNKDFYVLEHFLRTSSIGGDLGWPSPQSRVQLPCFVDLSQDLRTFFGEPWEVETWIF